PSGHTIGVVGNTALDPSHRTGKGRRGTTRTTPCVPRRKTRLRPKLEETFKRDERFVESLRQQMSDHVARGWIRLVQFGGNGDLSDELLFRRTVQLEERQTTLLQQQSHIPFPIVVYCLIKHTPTRKQKSNCPNIK